MGLEAALSAPLRLKDRQSLFGLICTKSLATLHFVPNNVTFAVGWHLNVV